MTSIAAEAPSRGTGVPIGTAAQGGAPRNGAPAPGGEKGPGGAPPPGAPAQNGPAAAQGADAPAFPLEPLLTTHRIFEAWDAKKQSLQLLHADLFDSRLAVATSALTAVAALADTRSFPYVARLLAGAQEEVQCAAVRALGAIGHPDVPRLLLDLARTTRAEKVRREILGALAAAAPQNKDVLALVRHTARTPMGLPGSRAHAAGLLLKIGGELALEELLPEARDDVLDQVIASALENPALGPRVVTHSAPLYARLPARNRAVLVSLAAAHSLPESTAIFLDALVDPNADVRRAAYGALGAEPHHVAMITAVVSQMAEAVEANSALEDEAQQAIARMEKIPDARTAVTAQVRAGVMARIAELFRQLGVSGRKVSSDTHELGWLITRSKDYLEYYGDDEFQAALLRWLKGSSSDTPEGLIKALKATATRVEVRHFDGYSALAELIKNPKRTGIALVARELAMAKTGKSKVLWRLIRLLRLATIFLTLGTGGEDAALLKTIYAWARQEKLFRLAEAALSAVARVDIPAAEAACKECLALPLTSKVLAISSLHLLRELNLDLLEPAATRLLASQDDPYVTMNALEVISAGPPSSSGDLAKALLTRFSLAGSREVRDALVAYLGEKVTVDITESLKEPSLSGDEARRAAALAILDRRISNGLVANRDGTTEFLFRVLRGDHEPSRRSAALMLWKMGDEYAPEVLRDFLTVGADEAILEILRRLPGYLREPVLSGLAPLFRRESAAVHAALRDLLLQVPEGAVRDRALQLALEARGGTSEDDDALFDEPAPAAEMRSEKSTFKFERENMQDMVMFFSDIVGYSKKAQVLAPMQLSALLQEYEKVLLGEIETHHGELVKRMGDGHMIVFQEPLAAVLAAIRLQKRLKRFNRYRDENTRVVIRIGIHSGSVVRKAQGDVLGNAVNIASRLESSATPGSILISDRVQDKVKDFVHAREIGHITVKNIAEPIRVFEPYEIVLDLPAELDPLKQSPVHAAGPAAAGPAAAAPGAVTLDREVYAEIIRSFSALVAACRTAEAGKVPVAQLKTQVLDRWARLRPRLPALPAAKEQERK